MNQFIEFYNEETTISILCIAAFILSWLVGLLGIREGRKTGNTDTVSKSLTLIFVGSVPFINGILLGVGIVFLVAGLCIGVFSILKDYLISLIIKE